MAESMVDASIFEHLQSKIDEDATVREELRDIVNVLEKQEKVAQAALSRAHSTPLAELSSVVTSAEAAIRSEVDSIKKLSEAASNHPYYRYNFIWSRNVQDAVFTVLFCGYLGGFSDASNNTSGNLLTIEQVGNIVGVPVNLKDRDAFHLTIEEYLLALISLIDELARLARNTVTLGDYARPLHISRFIKDLHAGFQILNLKNDLLRRRSDGIKYKVKEVEDVVYDLSLRNLVPKEDSI